MTSGAAGVYIGMLLQDARIITDLVIRPGQRVSVSGDPSLPQAPSWGSGGFTVQERGSLALAGVVVAGPVSVLGGGTASLSGCVLEDSVSLMTTSGSLSLASVAVPATVLGAAQNQLSGAGSTLRLAMVTVPELPDVGELAGTMTVGGDGSKAVDPPRFGQQNPGIFTVSWGCSDTGGTMNCGPGRCTSDGNDIPPCTVSEGGRCVGRPGGYGPTEYCEIAVGGGGGLLGPCGVFDTWFDPVTLPDGSSHAGGDTGPNCPVGAALAAGGIVRWGSNHHDQGSSNHGGDRGVADNGCAAAGLCGLPQSYDGLGGGWQICFAA